MNPTHETPITYANDIAGLRLQLGQALIALSRLEAEIVGPMRQSELLAIIKNQLGNINTAANAAPF